jgi:helix-turn-helix, Psq domain
LNPVGQLWTHSASKNGTSYPSLTKEQRCDLAVESYQSGAMTSLRQTALMFNVNRTTLTNKLRGKCIPAKEFRETRQPLSVQEEGSMKRCLYTLAAWGWPATIHYLKSLATRMLFAKGDLQPLGQNWYKAFLRRHPDLQAMWSRNLDQSRQDASQFSILSA